MYSNIEKIKSELNNNIYIKRDDLLPFSFGGNKYRIALEFLADMKQKNKNCMIGYGSTKSNLSRVIANLCYSNNIPCYIVSPIEDGDNLETNNSKLVQLCDANIIYCKKENVAETVERTMNICKEKGLSPYYIYGDKYGKGNEKTPIFAYQKVYDEIIKQSSIKYDYIFVTTGTGMTYGGLLVGKYLSNNKDTKIIGISIARNSKIEIIKIQNYLKYFDIENYNEINIIDDYLCGGYGKYNSALLKVIKEMYKINGIAMDPTYTGKGYYGMIEYLKKYKIVGKNILFIHTGGCPLFFDELNYL